MEALSPRDVNTQIRVKASAPKQKVPPAKLSQKEKDHPPPPPEEVREPPSSDRKNGAIYKTGCLLGKGGFAICYEGQLAGTKRKYALKIVKSYMPQKKMEQKFQTELQIHSKMRHANIVKFHRAFTYLECTYIVLELCPNASLMDMVKKRRFITEPEVRFWTVQMAGAIKYMHAKGIIHRDLKMGNIFLDKDMNVKIGDFGLAALLMSNKELQAARRTTLCGTPNYIAPEILSKDKGGHDHAVDIWSLGIIIFAMLTGKPPFQSSTPEEIYRKARAREYDWPKLDTSDNFISDETKDLVGELLKSPEDRPDPDTIVQHPFFTCGWMPQPEEITPSLRERHPLPTEFVAIGPKTVREKVIFRNVKKICIKCEVGPWNTNPTRHTSTYRECTEEEKFGLTPKVPLHEDIVYRPFHEWLDEQEKDGAEPGDGESTTEVDNVSSTVPPPRDIETRPQPGTRPTTQSFAAQQRARPQPSTSALPSRLIKRQPESALRPTPTAPNRRLPSRRNEAPVPEAIPEATADVEDRLAADLVNQLRSNEAEIKPQNPIQAATSSEISPSIFSPREKVEFLPQTRPDTVLAGLRKLQAELERALNSRSMSVNTSESTSNNILVVKWVDYTNKFGLGYILSNGSVGCIFKEAPVDPRDARKGILPTSCVVVRNAERHLRNRANESYPDRLEAVPMSGHNVEFYEHTSGKGVAGIKVNPQTYRLPASKDGEIQRLAKGTDEWDIRRRANLVLWKKFANYMVAYGRDLEHYSTPEKTRKSDEKKSAPENVVTFYQRWGDVGCWFFGDGHFQFNFPDHTKIVLSSDGVWCDFYHLPIEAARDLEQKGTMGPDALDDRQHLSHPLQTLLNFMTKSSRAGRATTRKRPEIHPILQGIPQANDFRRKVEFILRVVKEWTSNGGLGKSDMSPEGRLRWKGYREQVNVEIPYKHVWVSVGGGQPDERRVAWFDPTKPDKINPDMEG